TELDAYGNPTIIETREYELKPDGEDFNGFYENGETPLEGDLALTLDESMLQKLNLTLPSYTIETSDFYWKSGRKEVIEERDFEDRVLRKWTYQYSIENIEDPLTKYFEGTYEQLVFDLNGKVVESRTLQFRMIKGDEPDFNYEDENLYVKDYTEIIIKKNKIDAHGNPQETTENHYRFTQKNLTKEQIIEDNGDIDIDNLVGGGLSELEYGSKIYSYQFTHKGSPKRQIIYNYIKDRDGNLVYTDGQVINSRFKADGRLFEKVTADFMLPDNFRAVNFASNGQAIITEETADAREFLTARRETNVEWDSAHKNATEIHIEEYDLVSGNTIEDVLIGTKVRLDAFLHVFGREIKKLNFNTKGIPEYTLTYEYVMVDGDKEYVDGKMVWNKEIEDEKRITEIETYDLEFRLLEDEDGNPLPSDNLDNYEVIVRKVTTTHNLEYDSFNNILKSEVKVYEVGDGHELFEPFQLLSQLYTSNLQDIQTALHDKFQDSDGNMTDAFAWKRGTYTENLCYDNKGQVLVNDVYHYTVEEQNGSYFRKYKTLEKNNLKYDLRGNVIEKINVQVKMKFDAENYDINDYSLYETRSNYIYFATDIEHIRNYNPDTRGNFHKVEQDNYSINDITMNNVDSIFESDESTYWDDGLEETELKVKPFETVATLRNGTVKENFSFNWRGGVQKQTVYYYDVDESGIKQFNSGETILNQYDRRARNIESVIATFAMEITGSPTVEELAIYNSEVYSRSYETLTIKRTLSFDPSGDYPEEVNIRNFDIEDENIASIDDILSGGVNGDLQILRDAGGEVTRVEGFREIYGSEILYQDYQGEGIATRVLTDNYVIQERILGLTYFETQEYLFLLALPEEERTEDDLLVMEEYKNKIKEAIALELNISVSDVTDEMVDFRTQYENRILEKRYVDGSLKVVELSEDRIVKTSIYEMDYILRKTGEGDDEQELDPTDLSNYDVKFLKLIQKEVSKDESGNWLFDWFDNVLETETKEFETILEDENEDPTGNEIMSGIETLDLLMGLDNNLYNQFPDLYNSPELI
ncbi:hypothetical protein BVX93_01125, partial [bacterium B13(2017)]